MKNLGNTILASCGLAAAILASTTLSVTSTPVETEGYALLGHSLGTGEREFRIKNDFADPTANDNNLPHVDYPGASGAVMAIWKGCVEWASRNHGTGGGDGTGNVIGSGGANFDPSYQGTTSSTTNFGNIHRTISGSSGSTLAYQQGGSFGWNIRYYEGWTWNDGPNTISGNHTDIQGVATHEFGHALGLSHSSTSGATMYPSISGTGTSSRSIHPDDIAGLQAIYGAMSATKPAIFNLSGSTEIGQTLIINGNNFTSTNNEVWFTKSNSNGTATKVTGVPSPSGTQISVTIPSNVQDGDVLVRRNQTGNSSISNPWPIDIDTGSGNPPVPTGVTPATGPNAGYTVVEIAGVGFGGANSVQFDGVPAISFSVINEGLIEAVTPPGTLNQVADIRIEDNDGVGLINDVYTYGFNQMVDIDAISPASGSSTGGDLVTITGPNLVPIFNVQFNGVLADNLTIISATEIEVVTPAGAPGFADVTVQGFGTDTLVGAYEFIGGGQFVNIGPGTPGLTGTPVLMGIGDLTPNGGGATLSVSNVAPSAAGVWFISLTEAFVPFLGGTLYPFPILLEVPVAVDGGGNLNIPLSIPLDAAGLDVVCQMWFADAASPSGIGSGTNGLRLEIP